MEGGGLEEVFDTEMYRVEEEGFLKKHGGKILKLLLIMLVSLAISTSIAYSLPDRVEVIRTVTRVAPVYHSTSYEELSPGMRIIIDHPLYSYDRVYPKTVPSLTKSGWIIVGFIRELYDPETVEFHYIVSGESSFKLKIQILDEESYANLVKGVGVEPLTSRTISTPPYIQNGTLKGFATEEVRDSTVYLVVENVGDSTAKFKLDIFSKYEARQYEEVEVEHIVFAKNLLLALTIIFIVAALTIWWRYRIVSRSIF